MNAENKAAGLALAAGIPVHLVGIPGIGKTALAEAFSTRLGLHLETLIASVRDRTDFGGLPYPSDGQVKLLHLPWVERLIRAPHGAILFLDELGTAPSDVRPALLRVILERVVGDTRLDPARVRLMAASNPGELGEGEGPETWSLAFKTRMCHIRYPGPPADKFADAQLMGWEDPLGGLDLPSKKVVETALPEARALVAAFIRRHPEALAPLPKPGQEVWGWANHRTWQAFAGPALAAWIALGRPETLREALQIVLVGCLGPYGETFAAWVKEQSLPDPEEILRDPERFPLPDRVDILHVVTGSVTAAAIRQPTLSRWEAAWTFIKRLPQDMGILGARNLALAYQEGHWKGQPVQIPGWIKDFIEVLNQVEKAKA
jgi:hypothetical protein